MSSAISPAWTSNPRRPSASHNDKLNVNDKSTMNSPLLFDVLNNLSLTESRTVLDLGSASQSSIDFFSDYWCKLFISNSICDLHKLDLQADDAEQGWLKILANTIHFYNQQNPDLDIIFLWSLPNYLTPHHLKELIEYLLPHTSRRLMLHAYIHNTQMMPAVPATYHIRRDHTVEVSVVSSEQRNCPLYHLSDLRNCFNPLKVEHSVMLSTGIQEYLFSI